MALLSCIPTSRRFPWESDLRRGSSHRQLVAVYPGWASQFVTHKVHFWRTFLFISGGSSLSISCFGKQTKMALRRAALLYRVLYLDLGICRTGFWLVPLLPAEKEIQLTNYPHYSFIYWSNRCALFCLSCYL